ncbi:MAG: YvrJ family protein [Cellulosilyticaceae bacterium]
MEEILSQIGNFGFPIILSMYLLVRIEGKMEQLSNSIIKLTLVLEKKEQRGDT